MLRRLAFAAVAAGLAVLAAAGPAAANSTVNINPGNILPGGTLAGDPRVEHNCEIGGGPVAGQDIWVFVLPGKDAGDFVSVTAYFDTTGDGVADTHLTIPTDGGALLNDGPQTPKAYIATPSGWRLTDATAVISGTASFFNLTHTCVGSSQSPSPSPAGTPSQSPSTSPTPSTSESPGESPSSTPSESTSTSPGASPSESPSTPGTPSPSQSSGGGLPVTGAALTGYALTGTVLVAAGVFALLLARRRRTLGE